jgi:hypothetical protein
MATSWATRVSGPFLLSSAQPSTAVQARLAPSSAGGLVATAAYNTRGRWCSSTQALQWCR